MKTLIILLIALFSIPSVSLAGTSGAIASSELSCSSLETVAVKRQSLTKPWRQRRMGSKGKGNMLKKLIAQMAVKGRPSLGKKLSVLSLIIGVLGMTLMIVSLPIVTGLFVFLLGAFLTICASWIAILSLVLLDKKTEKGYWRLSFITMCATLIPVAYVFLMSLFLALLSGSSFITPANVFG